MPRNLVQAATPHEERLAWVARLPSVLAELEARWDLELGPPYQPGGRTAWVAPARNAGLGEIVLKVAWRHVEARDEAAGLREWGGAGAVRLYDTAEPDPETTALLIERCQPGTTLTHRPESEQDQVVARLLGRLWRRPAPASTFRPLQSMCDAWADECEQKLSGRTPNLDPNLVRHGIALFRSLPRSGEDAWLLCTDLHAGNVLMAQREPWLTIDPKPYVGDRTYDVLQHILNCEERLQGDPIGLVRRMAALCDLDPDRLAVWLFARCVQESFDSPPLADVARRIAPG
jgi:streptomycin 6-kinase